MVTLERESKRLHSDFRLRLLAASEVQQCYDLAGTWDLLVMIAASSMPRCRTVIDDLFLDAPNVKRYETSFVYRADQARPEYPDPQPRGIDAKTDSHFGKPAGERRKLRTSRSTGLCRPSRRCRAVIESC